MRKMVHKKLNLTISVVKNKNVCTIRVYKSSKAI